MKKVLISALLAQEAGALLLPSVCPTRAPAACAMASARAAICLCDAGEEAAPVEAAAAPVEAAAEAAPAPARTRKPKGTPLEELEVGQEIEGKIRSVMNYGAFVDVGASTDGLLHVSEICNEFVKDATEKLTAGDTVKCRVKSINLEKGQLALTSKDPDAAPRAPRRARPDLTEYESADPKEFVTGTVNSITDFGAFVTLKEGVDGLVHISQIKEGGVGKVSDVLSIGQEVKVRIEQVDKGKRRIGLSMLEWSEEAASGRGRGRGGGGRGGPDIGFGSESDAPFAMTADELETLAVGDDFASPFEAAFERAATVSQAKSDKKKYAAQVL